MDTNSVLITCVHVLCTYIVWGLCMMFRTTATQSFWQVDPVHELSRVYYDSVVSD